MAFEEYVTSNGERLRRGYTTGTCAALAAKAAAELLLCGTAPENVSVLTPAGVTVTVQPEEVHCCDSTSATASVAAARATASTTSDATEGTDTPSAPDTPGNANAANAPGTAAAETGPTAHATIIKDAGDDYDVTYGTRVCAFVTLCDQDISIDGGIGVGRVTCPGLDQPVGNAAINSGPRAMIRAALEDAALEAGYLGGFNVVVEVPEGAEIGRKTFNPSLGIVGGISILGTSGIVEPRSLKALQDALKVEIHVRAANGGKRLIVVPGNYGQAFLETMGLPDDIPVVSCANFIGFTLDQAAEEGFEQLLLVGHIGKLVKVAGGVMDTHSRMADCRREIFAAHAAAAGASQRTVLDIFDCMTTDACLDVVESAGVKNQVLDRLAHAIQYQLEHRAGDKMDMGAVIFSNKTGLLACTDNAKRLMDDWKRKEE